MGLSEIKPLFFNIRKSCKIIIKKHAFADYPERGFSQNEILSLVQMGVGRLEDNKSLQAIENSYLFYTKDAQERECKLVLLIKKNEDDKEHHSPQEEYTITICSAYREIKP